MEITGVPSFATEGIDERVFGFGLRLGFRDTSRAPSKALLLDALSLPIGHPVFRSNTNTEFPERRFCFGLRLKI
jgi:hypothetical protein